MGAVDSMRYKKRVASNNFSPREHMVSLRNEYEALFLLTLKTYSRLVI